MPRKKPSAALSHRFDMFAEPPIATADVPVAGEGWSLNGATHTRPENDDKLEELRDPSYEAGWKHAAGTIILRDNAGTTVVIEEQNIA